MSAYEVRILVQLHEKVGARKTEGLPQPFEEDSCPDS